MAFHDTAYAAYPLTDFFQYDEKYWRQYRRLSLQQQYIASEAVASIHTDLLLCISAAMDYVFDAEFVYQHPKLEVLARLLWGLADEAVIIRERVSVVLYRHEYSVVAGGLQWNAVH